MCKPRCGPYRNIPSKRVPSLFSATTTTCDEETKPAAVSLLNHAVNNQQFFNNQQFRNLGTDAVTDSRRWYESGTQTDRTICQKGPIYFAHFIAKTRSQPSQLNANACQSFIVQKRSRSTTSTTTTRDSATSTCNTAAIDAFAVFGLHPRAVQSIFAKEIGGNSFYANSSIRFRSSLRTICQPNKKYPSEQFS